MKKKVDLHMHSLFSDDGEYTPEQLVNMCYERHIDVMSLTDHNSVKGVARAKAQAQKRGITCIPGIEIDCVYQGINLHVLGYGINITDDVWEKVEDNIIKQEQKVGLKRLELINQLGFDITCEQMDRISKNGIYIGEAFGEVLLQDKRYECSPLLAPYRSGGERSDNPYVNFYWDYFAQGKPCYVEINYPTLEETIQMIKDSNGIAILAHPGNNLKGQHKTVLNMIPLGLQGIEVFSSYHTPDDIADFFQMAIKHKLLITLGSDFHGKTKPSIELGKTGYHALENQTLEDLEILSCFK